MTVQKQIDRLIIHRASEWLETLKAGDSAQHAQFVRWVTESPRHMSEFLNAVALDRELGSLDLRERFDHHALLQRVSPQVRDWRTARAVAPRKTFRRTVHWKWVAGLAAAALLSLSLFYSFGSPLQQESVATATGEQRSIGLPDGSVVHVNAESEVVLRFDEQVRDIEMPQGEALFEVARDARRPFRVHTRDAVVEAVGTQFNVHARDTGTRVSVIEGKVRVSPETAPGLPTTLMGGDVARVDATGKVELRAQANMADAVAWRQRRVVFDKAPLEEVVREFNRYNRAPRLRLEGIVPGAHHYSGSFDAGDPQSLAEFLAKERDLLVESRRGDIVVRAR